MIYKYVKLITKELVASFSFFFFNSLKCWGVLICWNLNLSLSNEDFDHSTAALLLVFGSLHWFCRFLLLFFPFSWFCEDIQEILVGVWTFIVVFLLFSQKCVTIVLLHLTNCFLTGIHRHFVLYGLMEFLKRWWVCSQACLWHSS